MTDIIVRREVLLSHVFRHVCGWLLISGTCGVQPAALEYRFNTQNLQFMPNDVLTFSVEKFPYP